MRWGGISLASPNPDGSHAGRICSRRIRQKMGEGYPPCRWGPKREGRKRCITVAVHEEIEENRRRISLGCWEAHSGATTGQWPGIFNHPARAGPSPPTILRSWAPKPRSSHPVSFFLAAGRGTYGGPEGS